VTANIWIGGETDLEVVSGFFVIIHGPFLQAGLVGQLGGVAPHALILVVVELVFQGQLLLGRLADAGGEARDGTADGSPAFGTGGNRLIGKILQGIEAAGTIFAAFGDGPVFVDRHFI
jgi:hypothetical protein